MAEKPGPAHVKMAHTNFPVSHVNKYGQWRTKPHVGPSYPFLPRGVFPCHVFQAVHPQREICDMRGPTSATKSGEEGEDQLRATSGKAGEQSLADDDVDWDESEEDSDGEDDPGCSAADAEESEPEDWACFMACPLSLSNLLSNPSKKQPKCGAGAGESGGQERRVAKPCRAVTNRWRLVYSAEPPSDRQCKVRFECGRGKDIVHEFEKGEGETLTVMEVQKARDLIKHHGQNAAKLLQQTSVDSDEDEEEGGSRGGESPGEAPAELKSKTAEYVLALLSSLQHVRDSTDSMNSSSNESDVEDEEDAKNGSSMSLVSHSNTLKSCFSGENNSKLRRHNTPASTNDTDNVRQETQQAGIYQ
ncbi:hypothetical protein ACOMHN_065549 [Nucella lapillus]